MSYKSTTFRKSGQKRIARSVSLPAPVLGLNTRDPLSNMNPAYAINVVNCISTPQGVKGREGYRVRNTGLPSYVETIGVYTGVAGLPNKMFAWSGSGVYDITSPGAVGATVVSGLSNARWSRLSMSTIGGQFLVAANGVDPVMHYNGTSWVTWTMVGSPTNPGEISGVNPNVLTRPITHQRRLWFIQEGTSDAWYLPIDSVGGVAQKFSFGSRFPRGGKLLALASWSVSNNDGVQNRLVAISENGDAVVYEGTDPSTASTWYIAGTWRLAAPSTERCTFQFGGDILYMSVDGLMPLSSYMQSLTTQSSLSDTIRSKLSELSVSQGALAGWQLHDVLSKNLLILNVPQIDPKQNIQFVYNTITKGWTQFSGWPAQCWATQGTTTLFGGYQQVCTAFSGYRDGAANDGSGGTTIMAGAQSAFTYLDDYLGVGARALQKHCTLARLNLVTAASSPTIMVSVNADFSTDAPANPGAAAPTLTSQWDQAQWDQAVWGGNLSNSNVWQSVQAVGSCLSVNIVFQVLAETTWVSTELMLTVGGVL